MKPGNRRLDRALRILQVLFYAAFVFLWFKDNFLKFRPIAVSPWIPLAGLVAATIARFVWGAQLRFPKLKPGSRRDWIILGLILALTVAVHVPYLVHADGLMDSDEAIPALQGKHISEGQIPAIYYYGARFQGSLPQQLYGLLFWVFGYSVFLVKAAALFVFLLFMIVQYFLVRDVLSREAAILVSAFYALPFMHLVLASFDVGSGFPFVMLLGAIIFSLTYRIVELKNGRLIPALGFVFGLAFWTHQISIIFLLTSSAFLLFHFRFRVLKYLTLILAFLIGLLPVVISELYWNFPLVRMLFMADKSWEMSGTKTGNGLRLLIEIITGGAAWAAAAGLAALVLGLAFLAVRSVKAGKVRFSAVFAVYAAAYAAVYLLSSSSSTPIIRYLYILYMLVPVLFVSAFSWIKPAGVRRAATAAFLLLFFLAGSGRTSLEYYRSVREHDRDVRAVTAAMEGTGEKYWRGHYWISYLLNSAVHERLIVSSTTVERYPAYPLLQDTETDTSNYVFLRDIPAQVKATAEFIGLLKSTGKAYKTVEAGDWQLVYGIRGQVYPKNLFFPPDVPIPPLSYAGADAGPNGVVLRFVAKAPLTTGACRLHAEIPGFAARSVPLAPGDRYSVVLPYPPERRAKLRFYLDYQGLFLDPTEGFAEIELPAPPAAFRPDDLEQLRGFGPTETTTGRNWPSLEREAAFRINRPLSPAERVVLVLYSAFNFDDLFWHGKFAQTMDILVNGRPLRRETLVDGHNTIALEPASLPAGPGPVAVELKFRYAKVFGTDHWKTAAYVEDLKISQRR
jgi:hypothetical protein